MPWQQGLLSITKDLGWSGKRRRLGSFLPDTEMPLKMFVVGDFNGQPEEPALEDRKAISVDKNNFHSAMKGSRS
ncbi:type VI secretion system contractile sheath small subunit [Marinobacter salarius]|uniref:type VI secretion system contractile sheath small subunit n=1 Tax=Marinobacter salarius TaxID=1420917 RepID=UPI00321596AC